MADTHSPHAETPAQPHQSVQVWIAKDGATSLHVQATTPADAFALLDELCAGLTARNLPYGADAVQFASEAAIDHAVRLAEAKKGKRR